MIHAVRVWAGQGGIVLLDEWSYWIKSEEIKAGTRVGHLLNLDEEGGVGKQADKLKAKKVPGGKIQRPKSRLSPTPPNHACPLSPALYLLRSTLSHPSDDVHSPLIISLFH